MTEYEYTVIAAPGRGEKVRGAKTAADRFSAALGTALNGMAAQGWEYVRAETLPSEERSGLTSRTTVWNNVLVFRRALAPVASAAGPARASAPAPASTPVSPPAAPAPPEAGALRLDTAALASPHGAGPVFEPMRHADDTPPPVPPPGPADR